MIGDSFKSSYGRSELYGDFPKLEKERPALGFFPFKKDCNDLAEFRNHGQIVGDAEIHEDGYVDFKTKAGYVKTQLKGGKFGNAITVSLWFKRHSLRGGFLIGKDCVGENNKFHLSVGGEKGQRLRCYIPATEGRWVQCWSKKRFPVSQHFNHVCVVYKRNVGMWIFVNGEFDNFERGKNPQISQETFRIGGCRKRRKDNEGFHGAIKDVFFFDEAISPFEVIEVAGGGRRFIYGLEMEGMALRYFEKYQRVRKKRERAEIEQGVLLQKGGAEPLFKKLIADEERAVKQIQRGNDIMCEFVMLIEEKNMKKIIAGMGKKKKKGVKRKKAGGTGRRRN